MERDVVLQVGVTAITSGDLRWFAVAAAIGALFLVFPWARWHVRDWRIRRAAGQGRHEDAALLALDHDEGERRRSLGSVLATMGAMVIGVPALLIFQENFADELEHMLGKGWSFAAGLLTAAFVAGMAYLAGRVRRNFMSPEQLAALEEEEEHQSWMRAFFSETEPSLGAGIAIGIVVVVTIVFLMIGGFPG